MRFFDQFQTLFVLGPILGLLLVGFLVSLRSGVVSLSSPEGKRLMLDNLSQVLIRIFGFLAGLLAVQQLVGFPLVNIW